MSKVEGSFLLTIVAIVALFMVSVIVVLIAPNYVDRAWIEPTSEYQVQMYEIADPNLYLSGAVHGGQEIEMVYHLKNGFSLLSFQESPALKIIPQKGLEKYVTKAGESITKLTSRLLLLRALPQAKKGEVEYYELFDPRDEEAFALSRGNGIVENWVDDHFHVIDPKSRWHSASGIIYVLNPREYRIREVLIDGASEFRYDPTGEKIASLQALKAPPLSFLSRKELIQMGEHQYKVEGCWYCHTDQTRTLVQDVVLNGSDSYPAPPSSPNEYIYQDVTFPGTKRNGPDLSRTGIKRPSRDWHKSHFWSPKTESRGSIMPAFRHFFDFDPRGTSKSSFGVPNHKFEAIYQYLMTKGTRITSPNKGWWLGKDPIQTKEIIEGKKR